MKKIILAFVVGLVGVVANASYLYWTIDTLTSDMASAGVNAARIYATNGNTASDYLADYTDSTSKIFDAPGSASVSLDSTYLQDGYSYVVELGNYDSGTFSTKYVANITYDSAVSNGLIDTGSLDVQRAMTYWSGVTYAVPEPTGAMLLVIGMAMLGLKRKKV